MWVFEEGSEAAGLDLRRLCFEAPLEELVATEIQQPALVATSLAILAALRERGIEPDYVVGHSVGEYSALAAARAMSIPEAIALVRERGLATAEAAREHPGIHGRDSRSRGRGGRAALRADRLGVAGELQLPGAARRVRRDACRRGMPRRGGAGRRAPTVKLAVTGAFHSPLVAKAAERLRPAIDRVKFSEPAAPFMSTVSAKLEPAQRMGNLLVDQLTGPVSSRRPRASSSRTA